MASSSSTSITLARRLGNRYEILQPIGRPFGYQQLLAKDTQQQCPVVIKSLTITDNTPAGDICCFEREIQLLESLSHPTIPRYIDAFTLNATDGAQKRKGLVLVQSHHGDRTLAQQVAKATYCEADIKAIAKQLLQGLVYLHSQGFIHRDIKPDSIAIASPTEGLSQVSWLNLGTVQYVQAQRNDALVGTYGYMPPEQVGGQATFASDLYSLGATLIYLATGHHLGDLPQQPSCLSSGGPRARFACSPTKLSASFQQWLNWLIEPAVSDRPKSAKQALAALNHLPLSMLKRRLLQPTQSLTLPVPIMSGHRDQYQPFFTQIKSVKKRRSLELVVPPVGIKTRQYQRALPPLLMGVFLLALALHLLSLLHFSAAMLSVSGLFSGLASLAAASLAMMGIWYSWRFLQNGMRLLSTCLFREIHIQIEADVLLIAYKYWLRSPQYIVNTRRSDVYSISTVLGTGADEGALRILTHRNRVHIPHNCYKLTVAHGALSQRDLRWLTSLLNDWRSGSASAT
ncbi:MAG: serine/threonine-protein kinase [Phormidesmis sp.]